MIDVLKQVAGVEAATKDLSRADEGSQEKIATTSEPETLVTEDRDSETETLDPETEKLLADAEAEVEEQVADIETNDEELDIELGANNGGAATDDTRGSGGDTMFDAAESSAAPADDERPAAVNEYGYRNRVVDSRGRGFVLDDDVAKSLQELPKQYTYIYNPHEGRGVLLQTLYWVDEDGLKTGDQPGNAYNRDERFDAQEPVTDGQ